MSAHASPTSLWYRTHAWDWWHALPIGNGRLGGMVHGRVCREVIRPLSFPAPRPNLAVCTSRARNTCSRIAALFVPSAGFDSSSNGTGGTSM